MSDLTDFRKWLWSDWGRTDFLTRSGIPPLLTNLFAYLAGPYCIYLINKAYLPREEVPALNQFIHNPFVLSAYAVFYPATLCYRFLESVGIIPSRARTGVRVSFARQWKSAVFKLYLISGACAMLLLALAAFWFRRPTK